MCGIVGFVQPREFSTEGALQCVEEMANAIAHRGPDDSGSWVDERVGLALAHRRLSIIDLSPAGHQPMISLSGRYVIVFNGEIYNHKILREDVSEGIDWKGSSDTETLLACIESWGLNATLKKAVGMFAMALWDCEDRLLYLARDRMGEKPLYYGWQDGVFLFGSELKALKKHRAFQGVINRNALSLFLRHSYVPAPYSIYEGINKLPAGEILSLDVDAVLSKKQMKIQPEPFWSLASVIDKRSVSSFVGDEKESVARLDELLRDVVGQQMLADVPLGAFLSGGVDSSAVVALMQTQSTQPVKTFSIGFNEVGFDESPYAAAVAKHLGTDHTSLYVSSSDAAEVIPLLSTMYDEPFSDSSQIPTYLVSKLAKGSVSVALSGDGGDELFCGYNRYFLTQHWWGRINSLPFAIRRRLAQSLRSFSPIFWDRIGLAGAMVRRSSHGDFSDKIKKLSHVLDAKDVSALYRNFVTHWDDPDSVVINGVELPTQITSPQIELDDVVEQMMALDSVSYLPDDILVKVDRAAMSVSLETRVPLLDHRVIEFAWSLPHSVKIRNGQTKWILREVLYKYVPKELIERPKMGFGIPIDNWLRGPLRDWAESLLDETRLRQEGYFHPELIRKKWCEHVSGERNHHYLLWDVLMFQAWLEKETA